MRSILSLVVVAGCAVASPTPLSPSSRQNAYDLVTDISSGSSGPLDLAGAGILSEGSGLLGGNGGLGGLHLRHVKRGLFKELSTSDVGGTLDSPTKGLSDLGLGGGLEKNKALLNYGNPQGNTCSTGHRYCCKDVRRYTDPRNAALIDGVLTLDDQLNKHLLGLNCHAITGSLVPGSCRENAVCCTGQSDSKQGPLSIGCTSIELSATN